MFSMKRKSPHVFAHSKAKNARMMQVASARPCGDDSIYNRMKVFVRLRPFSSRELENSPKSVVEVIDDKLLVFDPFNPEEDNNTYYYQGKIRKQPCSKLKKNMEFYFDRVFDDTDSNLQVYQETTKELVSSLLKGYNCCVFAYGATGSGKTYTMLGTQTDPGVIIFTTMDLYKLLEEKENKDMELSVSYFEIYNEIIYDLLESSTENKPLSLLDNGNNGMMVQNLSVHRPADALELLQMLEFGNKNRKQHPTDANAESSRSHAVFQIILKRKQAELGSNNGGQKMQMSVQYSKMSLIDLAGSERATVAHKSIREKALQREGAKINQSLLALGNCINSLAGKTKASYIPYRSSKLTLILRDSLGGKSHTMMIANVSPSTIHYGDTQNTLLYAQRAQGIKINALRNTTNYQTQPRDMKLIINQLTIEKGKLAKELEKTKQELAEYQSKVESMPTDPITTTTNGEWLTKLNEHKQSLDDMFEQRLELGKQLLGSQHQLKMIKLRCLLRETEIEKLKIYENIKTEYEEVLQPMSTSKVEYQSIYNQQLHYTTKQEQLEEQIDKIDNDINQMQCDLLESTDSHIAVRGYFSEKRSEIQSLESDYLAKQVTALALELTTKFEGNNDLFADLINFTSKAYHILNGSNKLSEEMKEEYEALKNRIKGKKKVSWRDNTESPALAKRIIKLFVDPTSSNNRSSLDRSSTNICRTPIIRSRELTDIRDITPLAIINTARLDL